MGRPRRPKRPPRRPKTVPRPPRTTPRQPNAGNLAHVEKCTKNQGKINDFCNPYEPQWLQIGSLTATRRPQDRPRDSQNGPRNPKSPQDGCVYVLVGFTRRPAQGAQVGGSSFLLFRPPDMCTSASDSLGSFAWMMPPRRPVGRPRRPQEAPKTAQDRPKTAQDDPKTTQCREFGALRKMYKKPKESQ